VTCDDFYARVTAMKRILIFITAIFIIHGANAYDIDTGLYPFADFCGDEIDQYCYGVDDLGNCMLSNRGVLGDDCYDSVFLWAGDRWGWHDHGVRDRWNKMGRDERNDYTNKHIDEYAARSAHETRDPTRNNPSHIMNPAGGMRMGVGIGHGGGGMHMGVGMGGGFRR